MTNDAPQYPLTEHAALVNEADIRLYLELLFSRVFWKPSHFVCLRGIGEKHTAKEGRHQEDIWVQPGLLEFPDEQLADRAVTAARLWGQHHVATFLVPCVLREARGTSQSVELFTALVVDLDTGDTRAKSAWLDQHLGPPTMVVASGGTTDQGTPKLHVYYVLEEPEADIAAVVEARHQLALKAGGDLQFGRGTPDNPYGRAHQPIRIPGSVHAKSGNARASRLVWSDGPAYDFAALSHAIREAPRGPWSPQQTDNELKSASFDFGPAKNQRPDIADALSDEVHEGGEDKTRWSEFNRVAGFHIAQVRRGELTVDEAKTATAGWVLAKMVPPWPEARIEREWSKLLQVDVGKHGALPAIATEKPVPLVDPELGLRGWATHRWTQTKAPPREFIVDGLILAGKPHLLVAEGGAGKTFAMLDLALKVASAEGDELPVWLGQPVRGRGCVVLITTEDDADELHRRLEALDPEGARFRAGDRLIVLPTLNAGGGFTLGQRDRTGQVGASPRWMELLGHLEALGPVKLVVVDTLNSTLHGEENSATVINEYMRLLHPVCGKLGAALVLTHHIRKQNNQAGGQQRPISSAEDMFNAIRGSSALPASFRVVLGLWHSHDYARRLKAMGLPPTSKQLWRFGVLKANNPEMIPDLRFLLRESNGVLVDATERAVGALSGLEAQRSAWLTLAVRLAAEAGAPFLWGSKDAPNGLYQRRLELPAVLRTDNFGRTKLYGMVEALVDEGALVVAQAGCLNQRGQRRDNAVLDVPEGPYAGEARADVLYGAAFTAPRWEKEFTFDPTDGSLGSPDRPRLVMLGVNREADTPDDEADTIGPTEEPPSVPS